MFRFLVFTFLALVFSATAFAEAQDLILPVALNGYTTAPIQYQTMIRIVNMSSSSVEDA